MKKILLTLTTIASLLTSCEVSIHIKHNKHKDGCYMNKDMIGYDDPRTHNK